MLTCEISATNKMHIFRNVKVVSSVDFQGESESAIIVFVFHNYWTFFFGNMYRIYYRRYVRTGRGDYE